MAVPVPAFDWALIPRELPLPLILAGGLDPDNVGEAVRARASLGGGCQQRGREREGHKGRGQRSPPSFEE